MSSDCNYVFTKDNINWDEFPKHSKKFIEDALQNGDYENIYNSTNESEKHSREILVNFEENYPNVINGLNIDEILKHLADTDKK